MIALDTSGYDLLVTFFQHEYYAYGGAYSTVGGRYGTCDTLGYGLSNLTYINIGVVYGISSYRLNGSCYRANYWTETGYDGYTKYKYGQNNPFVGVTWNDHLYSMQIRA